MNIQFILQLYSSQLQYTLKERKHRPFISLNASYFFLSGTTTLGGFWPAQLSLSILSGTVLRSAAASSMSNPQPGGEPVI